MRDYRSSFSILHANSFTDESIRWLTPPSMAGWITCCTLRACGVYWTQSIAEMAAGSAHSDTTIITAAVCNVTGLALHHSPHPVGRKPSKAAGGSLPSASHRGGVNSANHLTQTRSPTWSEKERERVRGTDYSTVGFSL